MAEKWAAMSKGARILLASVLFYVLESVVILATDADANNGYASVLIGAVTSTFGAFLATAAWNTDYVRAQTNVQNVSVRTPTGREHATLEVLRDGSKRCAITRDVTSDSLR